MSSQLADLVERSRSSLCACEECPCLLFLSLLLTLGHHKVTNELPQTQRSKETSSSHPHVLRPRKPWAEINSFSSKLVKLFCHSYRMVANTLSWENLTELLARVAVISHHVAAGYLTCILREHLMLFTAQPSLQPRDAGPLSVMSPLGTHTRQNCTFHTLRESVSFQRSGHNYRCIIIQL